MTPCSLLSKRHFNYVRSTSLPGLYFSIFVIVQEAGEGNCGEYALLDQSVMWSCCLGRDAAGSCCKAAWDCHTGELAFIIRQERIPRHSSRLGIGPALRAKWIQEAWEGRAEMWDQCWCNRPKPTDPCHYMCVSCMCDLSKQAFVCMITVSLAAPGMPLVLAGPCVVDGQLQEEEAARFQAQALESFPSSAGQIRRYRSCGCGGVTEFPSLGRGSRTRLRNVRVGNPRFQLRHRSLPFTVLPGRESLEFLLFTTEPKAEPLLKIFQYSQDFGVSQQLVARRRNVGMKRLPISRQTWWPWQVPEQPG